MRNFTLTFSLIAVIATSAGCGPGHRVSLKSFDYRHPSVRWAYTSGWQVVFIAFPESIPFALPMRNAIRKMRTGDGCVVLYEDALGDFGGGLARPVVTLDIETGHRCTCEPLGDEARDLPTPTHDGVYSLGHGIKLRIENEPFALFARDSNSQPAEFTKLLEKEGHGFLDFWSLVGERRLLLLTVVVDNSLRWNSDSLVICVDLDALNAN